MMPRSCLRVRGRSSLRRKGPTGRIAAAASSAFRGTAGEWLPRPRERSRTPHPRRKSRSRSPFVPGQASDRELVEFPPTQISMRRQRRTRKSHLRSLSSSFPLCEFGAPIFTQSAIERHRGTCSRLRFTQAGEFHAACFSRLDCHRHLFGGGICAGGIFCAAGRVPARRSSSPRDGRRRGG